MRREEGFTLIEAVAMLAIVALLAAIVLPRMSSGTTRPRLEGYALEIAGLLKADRNAAIRQRARVATSISLMDRHISSGAGEGQVQLPDDVALDAIVAQNCEGRATGAAIDFLPSGMSCGGTVAIARPGAAYHITVNWLTGGVEVVAATSPHQ